MKEYGRLKNIPPYMFSGLDNLKNSLLNRGYDIIDLSIGDPDLPTPDFIVEALKRGADDCKNHRYPPYRGTREFREAVADYYRRRFGVLLDADCEVIALLGSKEGIAHLSLALIDEGDIAIVPDPSYPVYKSSVSIAGGEPHILCLTEEKGYFPDFDGIDEAIARKANLMFLSYPNNPTGTVCTKDFYIKAVEFARRYGIAIACDAAYNEIVFDGKAMSILQVRGAKDVAVEFGTLSKTYSMTGWRIGYAVGNSELIRALAAIKENMDSGVFGAVQHAGAVALNQGDGYIEYMKGIYKKRRDMAVELLHDAGISFIKPMGGFYIWIRVPEGYTSYEYASMLAEKCGVVITPGAAFGRYGEGYCRLSLTTGEDKLSEALYRMGRLHP